MCVCAREREREREREGERDSLNPFIAHNLMSTEALFDCFMAGATRNCCRLGARSVYAIQPCTILRCHFIQGHLRRVPVCLVVTCHLHFWQNDRDLLRATAV